MISGDEQVDYCEHISHKYLADRNALRSLALGCGDGQKILHWAALGKFNCIDAYDLSKERIKFAVDVAKKQGYDRLVNYQVANVYEIEIRPNYYDVVLAEQSLHHFSPLSTILQRVNQFLKPDGYFIVNEFVGPTRFQWTDRQLQVADGLLSILPVKYRTLWNSNVVKTCTYKPGLLRMILADPSEAVESSSILPLLHQMFEVIEIKGFGGNILHLLFDGIAHHFASPDAEAQQWLELCFKVEDALLIEEKLQSDFIVAICRKRISPSIDQSAKIG